jgi:hypothetical protein
MGSNFDSKVCNSINVSSNLLICDRKKKGEFKKVFVCSEEIIFFQYERFWEKKFSFKIAFFFLKNADHFPRAI